jgi:hypothetical protein
MQKAICYALKTDGPGFYLETLRRCWKAVRAINRGEAREVGRRAGTHRQRLLGQKLKGRESPFDIMQGYVRE